MRLVQLIGRAGIQASSGPPVAGFLEGPGAPAIQQRVDGQPHGGTAGFGTAAIVGAKSDRTLVIERRHKTVLRWPIRSR